MNLSIQSAGKQYRRDFWGLRGFSLELEPGVLGLLGPNGAGKSTLMRILATVTELTEGTVRWNGVNIAKRSDELRQVLGYLPQDFGVGVYPNLNAREFLEHMAAVKGLDAKSAKQRIDELLELVNLIDTAKRPLGGYSGGMRQRVGIAQALLNDPQLLIVDEPTAGLDPEERVRFRNLIADLSGERIVILSTHIVSDIEAAATSIAIINKGQRVTRAAQFANCNPERQIDAGLPPLADYPAFTYDGITWIPSVVISRLSINFVGVLITLLAAWLFHRFDPAKADKTLFGNFSLKRTPAPQTASTAQNLTQPQKQARLTPLAPVSRSSTFSTVIHLFAAELHLTLKGKSWFWYLCSIGLFIALALSPLNIAQLYLLPIAFVLPLTIWSNLGVREVKHRAEQIIFSTPHLLTRQLPVTWLTGIFVALVLTSPLLLRLAFASAWSSLSGLIVGILFVPSLAMAIGVWSNGSKIFEGGYLFFWYLASMCSIATLDFMGRVPVAHEQGIHLIYLLITLLLMVVTYFGRQRQITR